MIDEPEYKSRRLLLAQKMPAHSVAVVPAAREVLRNGDAHYRFRQSSDFYYLTGLQEPDAVLLIVAAPKIQTILLRHARNEQEEQWTGKRVDHAVIMEQLGLDAVYSLTEWDTHLSMLVRDKKHIFWTVGQDETWDKRIISLWQQTKKEARGGVAAPEMMVDLTVLLSEMRLLKSPGEIAVMREAAGITVAGHQRAMRACHEARYEYELEAELLYEFTRQGSRSVAYDTIVAGGDNACTLHYTANDQALLPGELVLIDAGAEFQSYAADVTRTFPVNGRFSHEQRLLYDLVLRAQQAGIAVVRPGILWPEVQRAIVAQITEGLIDLGILKGTLLDLIANGAYKRFYMHTSGHWLGLDVHDCGSYQRDGAWRPLLPGMVLTVEPGLYIPKGMPGVDPCWQGIGIRIEDDILVTAAGHENLTAALVVEANAIEALLNG